MSQHIVKYNFAENILNGKVLTWLQSFLDEAELFEKANSWDEFWRVYKEEPLLSLLVTGLARNDSLKQISILREYPVYFKGRFIGSSDLFLNYHNENIHFFFEAKYERARWETGFIDWSEENRFRFMKEVETQITNYVEGEKDENVRSFIVILIFYVLDFSLKNDYDEYLKRVEKYSPPFNNFYAYHLSKNPQGSAYKTFTVLEVVGNVTEIK